MERKIGEIFEFGGEWYQCVESDSCGECSLFTTECGSGTKSNLADKVFGQCSKVRRTDNKHVIFKKLEKVGEPYEFDGHLFQSYRTFEVPIFTENYSTVRELGNNSKISIEIKQTKEDMEEKKIKLSQDDIDWLKKQIRWTALPGYIAHEEDYDRATEEIMNLFIPSDTEHSSSEKIGKNLKPFDLEAAKAGKPVCTRDGRKARIICFDRNDLYPIVALIECEDGEEIIGSYSKEGQTFYEIKGTDLMMLPEKKVGWANIYRSQLYDTPEKAKEAYKRTYNDDNYLQTIKIEYEE